jgi:hypothetical protein
MSAVSDRGVREPLPVERTFVFGISAEPKWMAKPKRMERGS